MIRNRLPIAGARRADCLKLSELTTNFKNFHQKFSARRGALCRLCANIQPDSFNYVSGGRSTAGCRALPRTPHGDPSLRLDDVTMLVPNDLSDCMPYEYTKLDAHL